MIFKPRIFISSTFTENAKTRDDLRAFFTGIGAEPLLYERNLTPSTSPSVYRQDVAHADFVIVIIRDEYGTPTDTGMSGLHEEMKIALDKEIPLHVYIKNDSKIFKSPKDCFEQDEFGKLIRANRISYYQYNNDNDLFLRIKETTFEIFHEIFMRQLSSQALEKKLAKIEYDYKQAIGVIKIIEAFYDYFKMVDPISTTLFAEMECLFDWVDDNKFIFINIELENLIGELSSILRKFISHHVNDYVAVSKAQRTIEIPLLGKLSFSTCEKCPTADANQHKYEKWLENFTQVFEKFKTCTSELRYEADVFL
ncbi:MAG: DUF4062 domain-containing protein [Clostridiales Family XIII bacterium]|jgi:hypothetical protein|nr:DUF4062 domain-containing protein [Clostridiales Family XIII bacterium]